MIGLPIAVALGALIGKSEYQLEVLKDCNPDAVEEGRRFIDEKRIHIALKDGIMLKFVVRSGMKSPLLSLQVDTLPLYTWHAMGKCC